MRIAVLLTGSGTTLENLFERHAAGSLSAEVVVVLSSRTDAYGLERARRRNVPSLVVERRQFQSIEAFSTAVFAALAPYRPDLICLAGFMSLLRIPEGYRRRVLNVHPALLPAFGGQGFYGQHVHAAVLHAGCKSTGCTVHLVDNEYDHGPILAQQPVPVLPGDTIETLAERVQAAERELYPQVIESFAQGRLG